MGMPPSPSPPPLYRGGQLDKPKSTPRRNPLKERVDAEIKLLASLKRSRTVERIAKAFWSLVFFGSLAGLLIVALRRAGVL